MFWQGRTQDFFTRGGSKAYMPKKVPNIQRIINNDILKIVNIVFSGGAVAPPPPVYGPVYWFININITVYHKFVVEI